MFYFHRNFRCFPGLALVLAKRRPVQLPVPERNHVQPNPPSLRLVLQRRLPQRRKLLQRQRGPLQNTQRTTLSIDLTKKQPQNTLTPYLLCKYFMLLSS